MTKLTITTTITGDGTSTEELYFTYDGSSPMTVTYGDDIFYYVTNLQGDVIAILNDQGTAVVEYTYDAWGNILTTTGSMASTLGVANPLTYRGYVYDDESGLYYLQSRYYNANVGRFINADALVATGQGLLGNNMFAYCANNPIVYADHSGELPTWAIAVISAVIAIVLIGADHYLAKNYPDGVAAKTEQHDYNIVGKYYYASGGGFEADINGVSLCDLELGMSSAKYVSSDENFEIDILNTCTISAVAELDITGSELDLDISAVASIYKLSGKYTFRFFNLSLTFEGALNVGAIGAGIEWDTESSKFKITPPGMGILPTFGIDFDSN